MIRVAIVADSPVLHAGLASVFGAEPGVRIVATTDTLDGIEDIGVGSPSAHGVTLEDHPDVVVHVPRRSESMSELLRRDGSNLDERSRGPATIVLFERMEASAAQEAYAAGASAVLTIDAGAEELRAALRAVAAGLTVLPARLSSELLASTYSASLDARARSESAAPLTSREREVLALLAQGHANKSIAFRLGITEHTVKTHVAAVYAKLNARNRTEVLVAAARQGLVIL